MTDEPAAHPTFATRFPPDDDETLAGGLMTEIAMGVLDRGGLREKFGEVIEMGEFGDFYPDEPEPTVEEARDLLDRLIAVHDEVVTERSPDRIAFDQAISRLESAGVAVSVGDAYDAGEGAQLGHEKALAWAEETGRPARGYAYVHDQDLRRAVLDGNLLIGFSDMSGKLDDGAVVVGRMVADALVEAGLSVRWDITPNSRILVEPIVWAAPFAS